MDMMDQVSEIIRKHNDDSRIILSQAFPDGGTSPLFGRLERAASNQVYEGGSMSSRYGIWANTGDSSNAPNDFHHRPGHVSGAKWRLCLRVAILCLRDK